MFQLDIGPENEAGSGTDDIYKSLVNLSIRLNAEIEQDPMLTRIVNETCRLLKAERVSLFMVNRGTNEICLSKDSISDSTFMSLPVGRGTIGNVAYNGELLNLDDARKDPRFEEEVFGTLVRSALAAPVISSGGEIIGVLMATNNRKGFFTYQDEEIIGYICKLISSAIDRSTAFSHQVKLSQELSYQARHDVLTGLPNRVALEETLAEKLVEATKESYSLGLLFLDLDRFKLINDTLGHSVGDHILQQVAHRLKGVVRLGDIVSRLGGDEFVVVLQAVKNVQSVVRVAQKLLKSLEQPFFVEGHELYLSGSIGISLFPEHGNSVTELLRNADNALYRVKENGKNSFRIFDDELNRIEQRRLWLVTQLNKAMEYKEFGLYYQPQLALKSGKLSGMEALIRWFHPELGTVLPGEFIPMTEETGLIIPLGRWVLEEACRQCLEWQRKGHSYLKVSVNVSALQFSRNDFVPVVLEVLSQTGLQPQFLELELTEGILLGDIQDSIMKLKELKQAGVLIAIDDFGTGYSSLSYIQKLPVDILKIDKSFVFPLGSAGSDTLQNRAILKTISTLGHSLGLRLIAEGVETKEQLELLQVLECQEYQGYLYSPPLAPEEFEKSFLSGAAQGN